MLNSANAITFGGAGNDYGLWIIRTSDNGIAVLGQTENQSADIFLVKFDSAMNVEWTKSYGDNGAFETPNSLSQTFDGGYLIAGSNLNTNQATLLRLNQTGDSLWSNSYGTNPNALYLAGYCEQFTNDQVTIGITEALFTGGTITFLCRTDTSGNITDTLTSINGNATVLPVSNGYLLTSTVSFLTPAAINLSRLDSVTGHSFTKVFYDNNLNLDINGMWSANSGNVFLTSGWTNLYTLNPVLTEFYLLQTDADGDSIWSKHWGTADNNQLYHIIGAGTNYYSAGISDSASIHSGLLFKFDSAGNIVWEKNLGPSLHANALVNYSSGYLIAAGDSTSSTNGNIDIWVMMADSLGNIIYNTNTSISNTPVAGNEIQLFPSPANEFVQLNFKGFKANKNYRCSIISNEGKLIRQFQINESSTNIDLMNFKRGAYFVRISDEQGKIIAVKKLLVNSK